MMAEMNGESINVDQLLIDTSDLNSGTKISSTPTGGGKSCLKRLIVNPNSPNPKGSPLGAGQQQQSFVNPIETDKQLTNGSVYQVNNKISSGKLGSDGESEASPECSLSPVEVDSLEGGSSRDSSTCDRRCSPDFVNCTHDDDVLDATDDGFRDCESSPDVGISGCRPVDDETSSISPEMMLMMTTTTTNDHRPSTEASSPPPAAAAAAAVASTTTVKSSTPVIGQNTNLPPSSSSPVPSLCSPTCPSLKPRSSSSSKVTTTESDNTTEPDSLEEFIKHETECAQSKHDGAYANTISPSQPLIDSLEEDSGLCQVLSSSHVDGEDLLSSSTASDHDDKLADSGVNLSDDLILIVDCSNGNNNTNGSNENVMTNLISTSSPLLSLSSSTSSPSHDNNYPVAIKNKSFPSKNEDDVILNAYDDVNDNAAGSGCADNDSVDNVTQNNAHHGNNHNQNGVGVTSNENSLLSSSISATDTLKDNINIYSNDNNFGDGVGRPTIIGQLAKPSDEHVRSSHMVINVSESNIIEIKSPSSLSSPCSSSRNSKLSVVNDHTSMLVNYDESEHLSHQPSPIVFDENSDKSNNAKKSLHLTQSSPVLDIKPSLSRPLAGIVGKQTGKIVKRETSIGIVKSSTESMIAEEIRQLKEREEELARMRAAMSKNQGSLTSSSSSTTPLSHPHQQHFNGSTTNISGGVHHHHHHHHQHLIKSTPSHCSSIDGKSSPALSDLSSCSVGTISNDSIDPVPSKPISLEILSGKVSGLLGESPIEREIRIAREREAELKAQVQLTRSLSNSIVSNECHQTPTGPVAALAPTSTGPTATIVTMKGSNLDSQGKLGCELSGNVNNGNVPVFFGKTTADETIVTSSGAKLPVFKQNSCGAANAADIQKLLATTRIQQEIEEQTQRELALKATGSIKTISQERTDLKVTKLTDIEKAGSTYSSFTHGINTSLSSSSFSPVTATTTMTSSSIATLITSNKVNSEPETAKKIETLPGYNNNHAHGNCNGLTGNFNQNGSNGLVSSSSPSSSPSSSSSSSVNSVVVNGNNHQNSFYNSNLNSNVNIIQTNTMKPITSSLSSPPTSSSTVPVAPLLSSSVSLLSSSLSTSSLSSSSSSSSSTSTTVTSTPTSATITKIKRTGFQPFMKKGLTKSISMHKFISSKGKTATSTGNPTSSTFYPLTSPGDLYGGDLRPPIMIKGDKGFRRGSISAESKIQEELKEMKAREEELRHQRARLMGLSQPNLSLIGNDEADHDDGVDDGSNNHTEYHGDDSGANRNGLLYETDAGLKRTISNPNISHDDDKKVCQQFGNISLKPRKNPLIAQWEKKIIKDSPNSTEPRF